MTIFAKGHPALAIVQAGVLGRLMATRIAGNVGAGKVTDIIADSVAGAKQRFEKVGPVAGHCTALLCHGCPCADCTERCHGRDRLAHERRECFVDDPCCEPCRDFHWCHQDVEGYEL